MKNGFGLLGIIIVFAVIASVVAGGGLYWNESKKQQSLLEIGTDAVKRAEELKKQIESRGEIYGSLTSIDSSVDTADWKTYRNEKYGFEVRYPENWRFEIIPDYDEEGEIVPDAQVFFFTSDDLHRVIIAPHGSNVPRHNDLLYGWKEILPSPKYARFTISILPINARQTIDQEKIPLLKTIVSTFKFIN